MEICFLLFCLWGQRTWLEHIPGILGFWHSLFRATGYRVWLFWKRPPRFQLFRGYKKTAGLCLPLPVNDGIIWKQSSQYSGLMSIYLQGVCSSPPLLSQQAHMAPCCRSLQKKRLFSSGCFAMLWGLFIQTGALVVWPWAFLSRFAPWNVTTETRPRFHECGFLPRWQSHDTGPIKSISILSNHLLPTPALQTRGRTPIDAKRSPFAYSVLLPQYLMWQPILRGHWLQWPPSGRKEYIFMWRWTAVLTNNIRKAMGTVTEGNEGDLNCLPHHLHLPTVACIHFKLIYQLNLAVHSHPALCQPFYIMSFSVLNACQLLQKRIC